MGIGIGGGLGPFRASVSTRGFGVGVGPVSAGTGWGGRRASSDWATLLVVFFGTMLLAILLGILGLAVAWPYILGMALAEGAGLSEGPARVVSWVLEVAYVVLVLVILAKVGSERERSRAASQAREKADEHLATLRSHEDVLLRYIAAAPAVLNALEQLHSRTERCPAGVDLDDVTSEIAIPRDERFLSSGQARLCAPRVAQRGGPKVQTELELGIYIVTDKAITFHGATRTDRWPIGRITSVTRSNDQILLSISGRQTVSGLSSDDLEADIIEASITWARELPGDPIVARRKFQELLVAVRTEVEETEASLAEVQAMISDHASKFEANAREA